MLAVILTIAVGLFFAVAVLAALASVGKYNALVTLRKRCWEARQEIYQCDLQILAQMRALLQSGDKALLKAASALCDDFEIAAHRSAAMLDEPSAVKEADVARRSIADFMSEVGTKDARKSVAEVARAIANHNQRTKAFNKALSLPPGGAFGFFGKLRPVPPAAEIAQL
jgi:hypothetical protein